MNDVYITRISKFLPNKPVANDQMEDFLGMINGKPSKSRKIVLRNNGIQCRYYALDKNGNATHTNAQMVALAVKDLFKNQPEEINEIDFLSCGTSTPDQLMPSHAVMVHGNLPETGHIEVVSPSGVCCSGMHAFKFAYLALKTGDKKKAVATGSERTSRLMRSEAFNEESSHLQSLEENPYVAFEKEFIRWMLSDGAGAFLMDTKKNPDGLSLKVEWIEGCSFASTHETCMCQAADKQADGNIKSYMDFSAREIMEKSVLSIKQDIKSLRENIVKLGFSKLSEILRERSQNVNEIDYLLPHLSSYFFENMIAEILEVNGTPIPKERWFTNLRTVGNVGAGSIYLMLEELMSGGQLKKGQKLLLAVPESARFSYVFSLLTVC